MHYTARRLFWIAAIGGAGYTSWLFWQSRRDGDRNDVPSWPPLDLPTGSPDPTEPTAESAADPAAEPPAGSSETIAAAVPTAGAARWVAPVDGACPDGYPIKANANSGIYHVPGGRFYGRTDPERCYVDAEAAEADGYRASKA